MGLVILLVLDLFACVVGSDLIVLWWCLCCVWGIGSLGFGC